MKKLLLIALCFTSLNVYASDDYLRDYAEEHKNDRMIDSQNSQQQDFYTQYEIQHRYD